MTRITNEEREQIVRKAVAERDAIMLGMPQSPAERQKAFKDSMREAGYVRLEAWVTLEQREKFRQIGGDEWLRKKIDAATIPQKSRSK